MKEQLLKKIENKEIEVGVVGLGYVGLPLAKPISTCVILTNSGDIPP